MVDLGSGRELMIYATQIPLLTEPQNLASEDPNISRCVILISGPVCIRVSNALCGLPFLQQDAIDTLIEDLLGAKEKRSGKLVFELLIMQQNHKWCGRVMTIDRHE